MSDETKKMWCSKCKDVVEATERNDGYATPDYGHYDAYVDVCPSCGNSDLEEIDLDKLDIDWEVDEVTDHLSAYDKEVLLTGYYDEMEFTASGVESCGEIVSVEDIEINEKK